MRRQCSCEKLSGLQLMLWLPSRLLLWYMWFLTEQTLHFQLLCASLLIASLRTWLLRRNTSKSSSKNGECLKELYCGLHGNLMHLYQWSINLRVHKQCSWTGRGLWGGLLYYISDSSVVAGWLLWSLLKACFILHIYVIYLKIFSP